MSPSTPERFRRPELSQARGVSRKARCGSLNLIAARCTKPKRVAIVLSNPAISTTTGWPVGFWWSELTHPYFVFTEKGYEVEIFSPRGGKCEGAAVMAAALGE